MVQTPVFVPRKGLIQRMRQWCLMMHSIQHLARKKVTTDTKDCKAIVEYSVEITIGEAMAAVEEVVLAEVVRAEVVRAEAVRAEAVLAEAVLAEVERAEAVAAVQSAVTHFGVRLKVFRPILFHTRILNHPKMFELMPTTSSSDLSTISIPVDIE